MKKTTHWLWIDIKERAYWVKVRVQKEQGRFIWKGHSFGYQTTGNKKVFFWADQPQKMIASYVCGQVIQTTQQGLSKVSAWGGPRTALCACMGVMLGFFLLMPVGQPAIETVQAQSVEPYARQFDQDQSMDTVYLEPTTEPLGPDEVLLDDVQGDRPSENIDGRTFEVIESGPLSQKETEPEKPTPDKQASNALGKSSATHPKQDGISLAQFQQAKRYFLHGQPDKAKETLGTHAENMNHEQRTLLSEIYFFECRQWVQKSEYTKALVDCQKATRVQQHDKADSFLSAMQEQAQTYYLEAYSLESVAPAQAIQKYQEAMLLGGAKSPWTQKSARRLQQLRKSQSQVR